jgi:hypothetical protein
MRRWLVLVILGRGDGIFTLLDRQHPGRYRAEVVLSILDGLQNPIGRNQAGVQDGIAGIIVGECEFDHHIFEKWTLISLRFFMPLIICWRTLDRFWQVCGDFTDHAPFVSNG